MEIVVGGQYRVRRRIGAGSFGEVFSGDDIKTNESVAIKLEPLKARSPQLLYESKLYLILCSGVCIPRLRWFGTESSYHVLVIDRLGPSLEDLFQSCHRRFSLKTVLMVADQMIAALEYMHKKSFLHRDVKPDNFLIGTGDRKGQVFVIDFGLSKRYRNPETHEHIQLATGKSLTGTARYASVNALRGLEQSRRDDLEALGYCLLYFLNGSLPWMGLDAKDRKQKYERIFEVKSATTIENVCAGQPPEFLSFLRHVRSLRFDEVPAYGLYRQWFRELFIARQFVYDYAYDWVEEAQPPVVEPSPKTPESPPREPGGSNGAVVPSSAISREEKTISEGPGPAVSSALPPVVSELQPRPTPERVLVKTPLEASRSTPDRLLLKTPPDHFRAMEKTEKNETLVRKAMVSGWAPPFRRPFPRVSRPQ
jgi:serine/threonine protein kinase